MKCQQNLATWIKTGKTGCSGLLSKKGNKGNTKKGKVTQVAKAAVAAGADGLMVEVHPDPENALSDGAQSLRPDKFRQLVSELKPFIEASGRTF